MKIKWENNSRVTDLVNQGKIDFKDVIERTTTDNFPIEAATVRLAMVREEKPFVTVHIRGKLKKRTYGSHASTCRVNMGGPCGGMESNGELCEDLAWIDVHNVVEKVKEALA